MNLVELGFGLCLTGLGVILWLIIGLVAYSAVKFVREMRKWK